MSSKVCSCAPLRLPPMSASRLFRRQSGPQPAPAPGGSRPSEPFHMARVGQNSSGHDDPVVAGRGSLPWRRPGAVASAGRCALWPRLWPGSDPLHSHTPPRAAARRYAALQMTLVHAHRGARRDSPVLPVRIFPVGLSRPNLGERPSSADATQTPSPCQDGPLGYVRLTNSPCHANAR